MIYLKTTLTMKMEKARLKPAEVEEVKTGWDALKNEVMQGMPEGVICELTIEEVDEPSPTVPADGHLRKALEYIRNAGGNATVAAFVEDHAPVGMGLWSDLESAGLVREVDGKIFVRPQLSTLW